MSIYKSTDFSYPDVKLFTVFSANIILQESVLSYILASDIIHSATSRLNKKFFESILCIMKILHPKII